MTLAFWITYTVVALLSATLLKICVRFFARSADNGWDNAFAYVLAGSAVVFFPVRWIVMAKSIPLLFLIPPLLLLTQLFASRVIYEINYKRALLLGVVHTTVSTIVFGGATLAAGVVAAYIMYGRIVSDPMILIRLVCRLLGIPFPF